MMYVIRAVYSSLLCAHIDHALYQVQVHGSGPHLHIRHQGGPGDLLLQAALHLCPSPLPVTATVRWLMSGEGARGLRIREPKVAALSSHPPG